MIGTKLYKIRISIPIGYDAKGRWYERKDGIEYNDCFFKDGYYHVNGVMRISEKMVVVVSQYQHEK